jgi:hypothetical protein
MILNGSVYGLAERAVSGSVGPWPLTPAAPWFTPYRLVLWTALSAVMAILLAAAVWRTRARTPAAVDAEFVVWITTALLISPLGWLYYFWLFAGPLLGMCVRRPVWRTWSTLPLGVALAVLVVPPGIWAEGQPSGLRTLTFGSAYFWSLASLWFFAIHAEFESDPNPG